MPTKTVTFRQTRFGREVLQNIAAQVEQAAQKEWSDWELANPGVQAGGPPNNPRTYQGCYVTGREIWTQDESTKYDTADEFYLHLATDQYQGYTFRTGVSGFMPNGGSFSIDVRFEYQISKVQITHTDSLVVDHFMQIFRSAEQTSKLVIPGIQQAPPQVFIGHGGNPLWRELADFLERNCGCLTDAYEFSPRAGFTTKETLERALWSNHFALLVMTAEDQTNDGALRARQNVIHEIGLFQGKLGFTRAIVLLEEGVEEFSNIYGLHQIRFPPGRISAAHGEVLTTIQREFGNPPNRHHSNGGA